MLKPAPWDEISWAEIGRKILRTVTMQPALMRSYTVASSAAHDFNDELTIVASAVEETLQYLRADDPLIPLILAIAEANKRCAEKAYALLRFGVRPACPGLAAPLESVIQIDREAQNA